MKVVIAPDSFKGSLTAKKVALAIKKGIHSVDESIEAVMVPMADGGEGTVESLIEATNGKIYEAMVTDPLGRKIKAFYGILGDGKTAVIEMASASGLPLLTKEERNPLITTSFGTGELIKHALDWGSRKIIIGLGGSATNDGGAGMLQALGVKLLDVNGKDIPSGGGNLHYLADIERSELDFRLAETEIIIANDVDNPFIGQQGASYVFGSQKGATVEMIEQLDFNLTHYANIIQEKIGISIHSLKGAGAAGGLGGALVSFLQGKMEQGINIVIRESRLEEKLQNASLVITGEGQMDAQTAHGKTPAGVAKLAQKHGIPTIAIVGSVGKDVEKLREIGIEGIFSIINKPMSLEDAVQNSEELLTYISEQVIRLYLLM